MSAPLEAGRLESWEGKPVAGWAALWGVPAVFAYDAVESTNDVARVLAQAGAPAGTVVLADHQTRGRGQHGRAWHAPPGKAVLLSAILRPPAGAGKVPSAIAIRVGLAAARALERSVGVPIQLRWPNDLVANGAKLGGILVEGVAVGESFHAVAGIGLNVLQAPEEFPADLEGTAISLATIRGGPVARAAVAEALARALAPLAVAPAGPLSSAELRDFSRRDILRHRAITIDGEPVGRAVGLDADGALRVERPDGSILSYRGGTVRPASRTSGTGP